VEELADSIMESFVQSVGGEWSYAPKNAEIEALAERNASEEWLFPDCAYLSEYILTKKRRYSFGSVEITLQMSGEIVENARIRGDFFGNEPIAELEKILCGANRAEIFDRLYDVAVERYIFGMTNGELIEFFNQAFSG
jgi:hypothetical protein